ncbi:MAG: hypothetical protein ABI743_02225 [bacterium]
MRQNRLGMISAVVLTFLAGCAGSGGSMAPTAGTLLPGALPLAAHLGDAIGQGDAVTAALGLYAVTINPSTASAQVQLTATRRGQDNDDLYLLPIGNFLKADSFQVLSVDNTPTTVDLTYRVKHPFAGPSDPTAPPSAGNRADLGIVGMTLFLQDAPFAAGNTFFTNVIADTTVIVNPDAYYQPQSLVATTGIANCFPYQTLVDESGATGTRAGVPNNGDPTGNFGPDGWTRSELGSSTPYNQWTGFGVLHQGQESIRTLSLDRASLVGETVTLNVAIVAKYNDPRQGNNGAEKRSHRLPPVTPDPLVFGYRMPHGALDVERVDFLAESGGFVPNSASSSTLEFFVTDWDARATETTVTPLSIDPDVSTVAVGEAGLPDFAVSIPGVLGDATVLDDWDPAADVIDDDTAAGGDATADSGRPGDRLYYRKAVVKGAIGGQTSGDFVGFARATDPEIAAIADPNFIVELDGSLQPLTGAAPVPVTYQRFTVTMFNPNAAPQVAGSPGLFLTNPCLPSPATFSINMKGLTFSDPETDPLSLTVVATPNVGTPITTSGLPVAFPLTGVATGPFTNPGTTSVTFTVYLNDADHPGLGGTPVPTLRSPMIGTVVIGTPWIRTWGGGGGEFTYDLATDSAGNLYAAGTFQGTADFDPGVAVVSRTSLGFDDVFVSKFNSAGIFQWVATAGSAGEWDQPFCVTPDSSGNVFVSGRFGFTVDFDPGAGVVNKTTTGGYDNFLWKLDPSGNLAWVDTWGSASTDWVFDHALDAAGNVHLVGRADGVADYDPGVGVVLLVGGGGSDSFYVKLNGSTGAYMSAFVIGNSVSDVLLGIALDESNGMLLSGVFNLTMDFDPTAGVNTRSTTFSAPYILKLDATSQAFQWVAPLQVASFAGGQSYQGLVADPQGNSYFASTYYSGGTNDFDAGAGTANIPPVGGGDAFLVKYNSAGQFQWVSTLGGTNTDNGTDVALDGDTVYLMGTMVGSNIDADPGPGTYLISGSSATVQDPFIQALNSELGCFAGARTFGNASLDTLYCASSTIDCHVVTGGGFQGTVDFDPGAGTQSKSSTGSYDAFLQRLNGGTLSF